MSALDVNEYFDGNVKSIGFQTETLRATVGVMAPGDYARLRSIPRTSARTPNGGSRPDLGLPN